MSTYTCTTKKPRDICEQLLKAERTDMIERSILASEVKVIDRLLERSLELEDAYNELHSKLSAHPHALKVFFELLQSTSAFWSPESNQEARRGRARLVEVNGEIEEVARTLASLLSERTDLHDHSGFSSDTFYHPIDAIHAAAKENFSYEHWVKEKLEALTGQFDHKYWPSLDAVLLAIADDAAQAAPSPQNALTEAGTQGQRASLADTFRAFFAAIEEDCSKSYGFLPSSFELSDRSVASLLSCALGLGPEQVVDALYVKRLRQRQRERSGQPCEALGAASR